jgi:ABC-type Fe3+-siderophore transport system permease subunit
VKLVSAPAAPGSCNGALSPHSQPIAPVAAAALGLCLAALLALAVGKAPLSPALPYELLLARFGLTATAPEPASAETILLQIRLPRIVLAGLVGAALAVAGATYQGVFRNPLADPYLLGIASGASLGAVLAFILPIPPALSHGGAVQALAFVGAIIAVAMVYLLARVGGSVPTTTLLLAGIAISAAASAATAYLMYIRGDQLLVICSWLLGGFNVASWQEVRLITPVVILSIGVMVMGGRIMNTMQFGEEQAATLGIPVEPAKLLLIGAATLATAAAVSVAGLIGFVGLVVPHVARRLIGSSYHHVLPASLLLGGAFLVLCDLVARTVLAPAELPIGVVTAFIGAPFFAGLLWVGARRR